MPLPIVFSGRYALRRAPTRGAPTNCLLSALCSEEGSHKGCPYRLSALGVMPWGGHPQGAPLPIVLSRRLALGRAPTRGAPTSCLLSAFGPGEGTLPIVFFRRYALGRAPTRGAPTDSPCPGEGTHKGRPYQLSSLGVWPWGGHPQGVPLPIRHALGRAPTRGRPYRFAMPWGGRPQGVPLPIRHALGRAPTRGAPTDSPCPGEGTHKGCPYRFAMPWGGHPQGVPLPIRYALGRAPTRGAPTRFRRPHVGLSQFDAIAL